ncbi:hypothetical protein KY343_05515, partial [Candidatus Woesearchaeota archaeon]|nr:hypothetical protein [Candidatus Woesearchaeota archaeon]
SVGFIVWTLLPLYIPLIVLVSGVEGNFGDALGAAIFFGFVYIASFILIMSISLIVGIILSIKKKKSLK